MVFMRFALLFFLAFVWWPCGVFAIPVAEREAKISAKAHAYGQARTTQETAERNAATALAEQTSIGGALGSLCGSGRSIGGFGEIAKVFSNANPAEFPGEPLDLMMKRLAVNPMNALFEQTADSPLALLDLSSFITDILPFDFGPACTALTESRALMECGGALAGARIPDLSVDNLLAIQGGNLDALLVSGVNPKDLLAQCRFGCMGGDLAGLQSQLQTPLETVTAHADKVYTPGNCASKINTIFMVEFPNFTANAPVKPPESYTPSTNAGCP